MTFISVPNGTAFKLKNRRLLKIQDTSVREYVPCVDASGNNDHYEKSSIANAIDLDTGLFAFVEKYESIEEIKI